MFDLSLLTLGIYLVVSLALLAALAVFAMSFVRIGPNEVGLVIKGSAARSGPPGRSRSTAKPATRRIC